MFYAVLGLLVYEKYASSKHSGVISYFNQNFVAAGTIPARHGRALNKAFDLRQRGDYRENVEIPREQAESFVPLADGFISTIRANLTARRLI